MPMTPQQTQEIARLRDRNLSPKQIARKLSLRPAEVTKAIRNNAKESEVHRIERLGAADIDDGTLPPLVECVMNQAAVDVLLNHDDQADIPEDELADPAHSLGGVASVLIARAHQGQYQVTSFMIDYWCVGIKQVVPTDTMGKSEYKDMLQIAEDAFGQPFVDITLKQAQSVIFGAAAYGSQLGFPPHFHFEKAKAQLGPQADTLIDLPFGRKGQPFFVNGPVDDVQKMLKTLRETVGEGNFGYSLIRD